MTVRQDLKACQAANASLQQQLTQTKADLAAAKAGSASKDQTISQLEQKVVDLEAQAAAKDAEIADLKAQLAAKPKPGGYVKPVPNRDPNDFGNVDVTLDPTMTDATLQSKIDAAGEGGVVEWAGSAHYAVGTNLRFLSGQKHYTDNGRIIVCKNTSKLDALVNLKTPKGSNVPATNVTISDLEFWGHPGVPGRPPGTAPRSILVPWEQAFLRRVKVKGAASTGMRMQADRRADLHIVMDTCETAFNVDSTVDAGVDGAMKFTELGECGTPPGDVMKLLCHHSHHNWNSGFWIDIGSAGLAILASEFDHNSNVGIHLEVASGPVLCRDNDSHDNGSHGIWVVSSASGILINNRGAANGGNDIQFTQDMDPASRSSLACPALARAGAHEGYKFADWEVRGNVGTVNNVVTSTPAIHYDPTPVP